jgi:hypothetical protein
MLSSLEPKASVLTATRLLRSDAQLCLFSHVKLKPVYNIESLQSRTGLARRGNAFALGANLGLLANMSASAAVVRVVLEI